MTFATFTNIIVILLCIAVLVQSVRLMRSFRVVQDGGLKDMVGSLDRVTIQARTVLADLKQTLATDGRANADAVARGEAIREELSVMVGIANAVAERLMESANAAPAAQAKDKAETAAKPTRRATKATPRPVKAAAPAEAR